MNKKSIIKKKTIKKNISQEDKIQRQQQQEFNKQQQQYKKMLEDEEYKKKLEEQKQEMIEEIKGKLFKLNRNLNIAVEKDKLLQQKINEMQDDIDYYKDQLCVAGIVYKEEEEMNEI